MTKIEWKRKFLLVAIGQMISLIGSSAVQFALIWWIASETDSAMMLGMSGFVAFVPGILLGPYAGVMADRYNRKVICICADLFIGIAAAVFAVLLWIYDMPVWIALVILLIRGIGSTFHQPSIQAVIPQLVPQEQLVKANGWSQMMQSGSFMLGPVIGAAMYAAFPLPIVLLTDLAGAVIASVFLAIVPVERIKTDGEQRRGLLREIKEGLGIYLEDRRLFVLVLTETLCMIFFMPLSSFYPLMTSGYFHATAWHGSVVEFAFAAGMMTAAMLFGSILRIKNKIRVSYLGLFGVGVTSLLSGLLPPRMWGWWIFMLLCGLMGASGNVHSIPLMAYMQESVPPEKMGRAFAFLGTVGSLTMPLGLLIASPVAEKIGVHMWFFVTGAAVCLITAAAVTLGRKKRETFS